MTAQVNAKVNYVIALAAALLPQTYAQARASPHWPQIELAMGMSVLNAGWKARWVAKGFKQIEGLHYGELHTAVAHKDTIRVFLSIVNRFDPEYDQVNIVSAFLNGELEETTSTANRGPINNRGRVHGLC